MANSLLPTTPFTGEELDAIVETIEAAVAEERDYTLNSGGSVYDYTDEEWPEVGVIKATRWEYIASAMLKLGQSYLAETCDQLAGDIRKTTVS